MVKVAINVAVLVLLAGLVKKMVTDPLLAKVGV